MRMFATAAAMMLALAARTEALPLTPLSLTDRAMAVHFSAAPNPAGFVISNEIGFDRLKGNTLIELFDTNNALALTFSQPVTFASFDVALSIHTPGAVTFETWLAGAPVGSGSQMAVPPVGFFNSEATLAVSDAGFDALVLHSPDAAAFAIDNLAVAVGDTRYFFTFDTPEPLTLVVFGAGVFLLVRRRKRPWS